MFGFSFFLSARPIYLLLKKEKKRREENNFYVPSISFLPITKDGQPVKWHADGRR